MVRYHTPRPPSEQVFQGMRSRCFYHSPSLVDLLGHRNNRRFTRRNLERCQQFLGHFLLFCPGCHVRALYIFVQRCTYTRAIVSFSHSSYSPPQSLVTCTNASLSGTSILGVTSGGWNPTLALQSSQGSAKCWKELSPCVRSGPSSVS